MNAPPALLLGIGLALGACKNPKQTFEERAKEASGADQVKVEEEGKRVTLSGSSDSGSSNVELGKAARIPADFPKKVPFYPGATLIAAVDVTDKGKRSHVLTLSAKADPEAVLRFYEQKLVGFGPVQKVSLGGMRVLSADDGKGLGLNVLVTDGGDGTSTVQLTTSLK